MAERDEWSIDERLLIEREIEKMNRHTFWMNVFTTVTMIAVVTMVVIAVIVVL